MQRINPQFGDPSRLRQHPAERLDSYATSMQYRRGQRVYGQNEAAEYHYRLLAGAARRFAMQPNGRRQIIDFLLPGDFFGFTPRDEHAFTVEAIVPDTIVRRYPRAVVKRLIGSDARLAPTILTMTASEICRLQARVILLGRITAHEKVNGFLLEMAKRLSDGPGHIHLSMSRYDIADYLGMSVETVSRALTVLKQSGTIKVIGARRVQLIDPDALFDGSNDNERWSAS